MLSILYTSILSVFNWFNFLIHIQLCDILEYK